MKSSPPFPEDLDSNLSMRLDRLIALSDGIFAFSMTLLAVNVNFPHLPPDASPAEINDAVVGLVPQILIYASSFLFVALYWQVHRRRFQYIIRNDSMVTWLNLLQLLFVAFLPIATGVFDTYTYVSGVVLLYAGTLAIIGILGQWLWVHAQRAGLLDEMANPIVVDYHTFRSRVTTTIYLLVMLTGLLAPAYALFILVLFLVIYPFIPRIFRFVYERQHKEQP